MRDFEDEPGNANDPQLIEDEDHFANPNENPMGVEGGQDEEISRLFEDARDKLEKIDENAKQQMKQVIVDLAKSLEGKVPTDSICMKIVAKLWGQVSDRFIRKCLEYKYKQKVRVDNARKQQQQKRQPQRQEPDDSLAEPVPLDPEDAEAKKKVIMVEGGGNQTLIQDDDDQISIYKEPDPTKDENYVAASSIIQTQEQQQQPPQTPDESLESETNPSSDEFHFEIVEPKHTYEDSSQIVAKNNTVPSASSSNYNSESGTYDDHMIQLEFSLLYGDIRRYMAPLYQQIGDNGKIWFSG